MVKARQLQAAILFAVLLTLGMGCELISGVDRSKIETTSTTAGSAGTGGTTTSTGGGGTGGTNTGGTVTGGTGGTTTSTSSGTMCMPVDDNNECTDDVCNPDGSTAHNNKASGSKCVTGGSQCDGNGNCVECLGPMDCPGMDDACQARTCSAGKCGFDFTAANTPLPMQKSGDCLVQVCDGNGKTVAQNDDNDLPDDKNACTDDVCTGGVASNPFKSQGTNCGTSGTGDPLVCDDKGQCIGCNAPTDCPGKDDECKQRTCTMGVCGQAFTANDTLVAMQTANDCLKNVCDGNGNLVSKADDADLPVDDGNACTSEACSGGSPNHPNKANGTGCDDSDSCTQLDACQDGTCTGGNPVTCMVMDQCHTAGTCDPQTGVCSNPAKADGTACNDGDSCTQTDTCQAGTCTGGNPVVCTNQDQCHTVGVCSPATGMCTNPAKADGASCNDGSACTQTDTCQAGTCTGMNPVTCTAQDQCHDVGTCNAATGACSNPIKANGSSCNDGSACTQTDTCQAGTCTGANPVVCTAQDQCHTAGTCNPANGTCSNPTKANGASCSDGDSCTQTDTCQSGTCTGGNPVTCTAQDQCHTAGTCNPANGTCSNPTKANGTSCSDGSACTQTDTCQAGTCTGANPVVCSAQDQCHDAGTCNPANGTCSNPNKANGSSCNDGNGCTQTDTCQSGTCTGGNPVSCSALDQCHVPGTCNPASGTCSNPNKGDGSSCNDGDACTQSDTCQAGTCTGASPVVCAAQDTCHTAGTCNPANGACSNPVKADGASCSDGNGCTQTDTCSAGVCNGSNPVTCSALDQCHVVGSCNPATGACTNPNQPDGTSCVNGGVNGACANGTCGTCGDGTLQAGELCDDGNFVSGDGCDTNCKPTGCGNGVTTAGEACDDGNGTNGDGCDSNCTITGCGNGILTAGEVCDDGNAVSGDGCDANCKPTGCGNGIATGLEVCDDGNAIDGDGCDTNCTLTGCTNGIQTAGEVCDDGNAVNGDGCDDNCTPTMCGNGIATLGELCDDGNFVNGDGCDNNCTPSMCGNGITTGTEVCDDGNGVNGDGCDNNCTVSACGNGIAAGGEGCDDGNLVNGDGCDNNCTVSACGNGIKAGAEACDDGNTNSGDGCSSACVVQSGYTCTGSPSVCTTTCGDGIRAGTEACDDGNTANGDCCSSACQLEAANCEIEPNNNKAQADLNGLFTPGTIYKGAVTPIGDLDYYAFSIPGPGASDVSLETFDGTGPYNCVTIDTKVALMAPDGTTQIAIDDDSGPGNCSLLDPNPAHLTSPNFTGSITPNTALQHLAPGTYYGLVRHFSNPNGTAIIPAYTFRANILSTCGNGVVESTETCDDGNIASGDGCSNICRLEPSSLEVESNNTCATANGPYALGAAGSFKLIGGNISPAADQDWYAVTISNYADLRFETFDSTGPGSCSPTAVDTEIQVFKSDCVTTQTIVQDQGGIGNCSKIDPSTFASVQHMAPGTYNVKVFPFSASATFGYDLQVTVVALCGNGIKEGSEACDGGPTCAADCTLLPVCGDNLKSAAEQCDDGNTNSGDGCSSTCTLEKVTEVEPNDTTANADTNAMNVPGLLVSGNTYLGGSFSAAADKDITKLNVLSQSTIRFELFDSSGFDCVGMPVSTLKLLNSAGTQLKQDTPAGDSVTGSGISGCAALVVNLTAGTYYIQAGGASAANYVLQVSFATDKGNEVEANNTTATANTFSGRESVITAVHTSGDLDYFMITIPVSGMSIRAEVIEGGAVACEGTGLDSYMILYNSAGTSLGTDDDDGRGYCSIIDGTGATPRDAFAHGLAAGTYYLEVDGYSTTNNYRLVLTTRNP